MRAQRGLAQAGVHDTHRTLVYTGRPMRIIKNPYTVAWEEKRAPELKQLLQQGKIPVTHDQDMIQKKMSGELPDLPIPEGIREAFPWLCGQVAGAIHEALGKRWGCVPVPPGVWEACRAEGPTNACSQSMQRLGALHILRKVAVASPK